MVVLPNQQAVYSAGGQQLRRELVAQPALLAPQSFVFNDRPGFLLAMLKSGVLPLAATLPGCSAAVKRP